MRVEIEIQLKQGNIGFSSDYGDLRDTTWS